MKKNIKLIILLGLSFPLLNHPILSLAGDAGTALKADTLRAEPFADAKSVGNLAKNDAVDIVSKKGAWLQVKSKKVLAGCDCCPLNAALPHKPTKLAALLLWLVAARELAKWFLPLAFAV